MNFLIHVRGDQRIYPVPNGLYELMADITREVLRCQPQDMYSFIYNYLEAQIKTRELTEEAVKILNKIIIDGTPLIKYLSERGITLEQAHVAASKIQNYWRTIKQRTAARAMRLKKESGEAEEIPETLTPLQADIMATKIQAAFRGYLTRKRMLEILPREDSYDSWDHDWLWKKFKDEGYEHITQEQKIQARRQFLRFLPRRRVPVNRIDLLRIVHGFPDDYEKESLEEEECLSRSTLYQKVPCLGMDVDFRSSQISDSETSPVVTSTHFGTPSAYDMQGEEELELQYLEAEKMLDEETETTITVGDLTEDEEGMPEDKDVTVPMEVTEGEDEITDAGVAESAEDTGVAEVKEETAVAEVQGGEENTLTTDVSESGEEPTSGDESSSAN